MGKSIHGMRARSRDRARAHHNGRVSSRLFLAGCSPAEPASASPADATLRLHPPQCQRNFIERYFVTVLVVSAQGSTARISFPICPVSRLGRECAHSPFTSTRTPPGKERLGVKVAGQLALDLPLHAADPCYILNPMVQCQRAHLDASFAALSDATRRGILERLGRTDASITDLAEKFHMTLTGMKKHVGVLEQAGLVTTEKVGRVRTCKLGLRRLEEEAAWIERYRQLWDARFEELDKIVESLKREERVDGRKKRK